jgi:catecholate siderophore receptor
LKVVCMHFIPERKRTLAVRPVLPLGALMLAASMGSLAQTADTENTAGTLGTVTVREKAEAPQGKDSVRAVETTIGKGKQALRDIPQSVTVVTEKLMDDRNLDTVKEALKNTAGITFLAAEGGEEDIRLRGFSLQASGDVFLDGIRDPAFYDRDTFNLDRLEVLRGSASMLFGRGSTGGAANQVSKVPRLIDEHQVDLTVGSHAYKRAVGDFNLQTGEAAALRVNAMVTDAKNNGSGSSIDKRGVAVAYRAGIGERDEFLASLYHLKNKNGMNYGLPFMRPTPTSTVAGNTLIGSLDPAAYYGLSSDYNDGEANILTLAHTRRFSAETELKTTIRHGTYERDQRASAIRACIQTTNTTTGVTTNPECPIAANAPTLATLNTSTIFTRGNNVKVQSMDSTVIQSDLSSKFQAFGKRHELLTGIDYAVEKKAVMNPLTSPTKPKTTFGAGGGGSIDEDGRAFGIANAFSAQAVGGYAQDMLWLTDQWKLLAGLRYDHLRGRYKTYTPATGVQTGDYIQTISEWSRRFGILYQPTAHQSFHLSYATSFNTSGDTYSYALAGNNAAGINRAINTPPESSENIELGSKLDWANGQYTTRFALFHSVKENERNTDQTSVTADSFLLSGKRHSTGFEFDWAGRVTPKWEVYASYAWIPDAKVDEAASATFGNRKGDRPGLIPVHSGTVWNTYQVTPQWRVGGGINFRSSQSPADITNPQNGVWKAPGFETYDLMAEYGANAGNLVFKLNLTNLTNKLYGDSLYRGHYIPGAGRLVQLTTSIKF